jgi:hypothetical protein
VHSHTLTAQSLTRIEEGLRIAQVTSKNNYNFKRISLTFFQVVAMKVELNPNAVPGGGGGHYEHLSCELLFGLYLLPLTSHSYTGYFRSFFRRNMGITIASDLVSAFNLESA